VKMQRFLFFSLIAILAAVAGLFIFAGEETEQEAEKKSDSEITLFLVGDIMLNRGVEYMIEKEGKGDFRYPFLKIRDYLFPADLVFGNLEGPISDKGEKVGGIYSFRAEPEVKEGLIFAGFDILSLANNHLLDYQRIALEETMKILREGGIDYVGAGFGEEEAFSVKVKEVKDVKIGFLAYTNLGPEAWRARDNYSGIACISETDLPEIASGIKSAKEKVDLLVVSLHAGQEYAPEPTHFQREFSRAAIESGADLVVGHHPHVVQEIERYQSGWIAYSLGNFVFDQAFSEETMQGLLLEVIIKHGIIKEVNPKEIKISDSFQPYFEQ